MTKIRNLYRDHPAVGSVILTAVFVLCLVAVDWAEQPLPRLAQEFVGMLWPVGLVLLMGYGFIFRQKGFRATLKAGMFLVCFGIFAMSTQLFSVFYYGKQFEALPTILLGIVTMIGIGIREEVIFRGIIGNALSLKYGTSDKGIWVAEILSAAMFSLMHLQNLRVGLDPTAMIAQLISTFGYSRQSICGAETFGCSPSFMHSWTPADCLNPPLSGAQTT